jgi:hypothetical protein
VPVETYAEQDLVIRVKRRVTITSPPPPDGEVGLAYSAALSATGGTPPYTWSVQAGALPPGLSLSAAGVISGTPAAEGDYTFKVRCTPASA